MSSQKSDHFTLMRFRFFRKLVSTLHAYFVREKRHVRNGTSGNLIRKYTNTLLCLKLSEEIQESIKKAVGLIEEGYMKEAVALLEEIVKANPESLEGWYNLGFAHSELDEFEKAQEAYDEALAIDNEIFEIWFNKADVLYRMKDFEHARDCYKEALGIRPDDAEAWNNLGNTYSRLGEGKDAIEAYTHAVVLRPDYAEAFYNKANAHFIEEEDERAIAYAEIAVELNPELRERVNQWINVARDRMASKKQDAEYKQKKPDSTLNEQ